jgi:drug/metabolite transporter (DMT)-like permease
MGGKTKSLIEIHLAVLLFGLAGLFGKFVSLPSIIIVLGRVFFASIALGIVLSVTKQSFKLKALKDYIYLGILGIILAIHWTTFFQSIKVSTVAVGLLSYSTFPVFTTFIEPLIFREKLLRRNVILAFVTLFGVALIIPKFELANNITQGVIWGTISGFTFAILSILNRKLVKKYSGLIIAFYQDGIASLALLPFFFLVSPQFQVRDILLLILLGVLLTALSHTLFIRGLATIKAQLASIIASLEPVYGVLFAFLFLHEIPALRTLIGGGFILVATFVATNDFSQLRKVENRACET